MIRAPRSTDSGAPQFCAGVTSALPPENGSGQADFPLAHNLRDQCEVKKSQLD
jgi:hypothetical protein